MPISPAPVPAWPALRVEDWEQTRDTLHLWTQIVGKVRMAFAPLINHWWQVTLYVSARGLTTSSIPYAGGVFDVEFDFVDHHLVIRRSDGGRATVALTARPTADFYAETMHALADLGIDVSIQARPNEVDPSIPFAQDHEHASYDPAAAHLFWQQLVQADRTIGQFRAHFVGKVSPVHFFWGAMAPSTPTPTPSPRVSRTAAPAPKVPTTTPSCASSCCPTMRCGRHRTPTPRCATSCTRPTSAQQSSAAGSARTWRTTRGGGPSADLVGARVAPAGTQPW